MKLGGLDIGTTGCKLTVFDENGENLGKAYRDYPAKRAVSGHEIDVSAIMQGVYDCIREMAEQYPDLAGIGVTSFGETFVMTDEAGTPLHTAMLYTDPRGAEECAELVEKMGRVRLIEETGLNPHEMYSVSKVMWVKKHLPEVYAKAKHIFLMEDYVMFHLTGCACIDYSLASRTMAFNINHLHFSYNICEAADIDIELFSKPVPTGSVVGTLTAEVASFTGLSKETKIVAAGHDQVAAAVGAGAFDGSVAVDGAGTVECLTPIFDEKPDLLAMSEKNYAVVPYVVPGKYVAYAFSYTGGALVQWGTETFAKKEADLAEEEGLSVHEYLENAYSKRHGESPTGLLLLPHFAGAATPYMDTGSKGAVLGLTADTTAEDLYTACLEGVVYEMALNRNTIDACTKLRFDKVLATGGGARSKRWMQMKADVLNVPFVSLKTLDAGTVGSAMMTGVAVGVFQDLEEAAKTMVQRLETYWPREEMHKQYEALYERYEKVYEAVRPLV